MEQSFKGLLQRYLEGKADENEQKQLLDMILSGKYDFILKQAMEKDWEEEIEAERSAGRDFVPVYNAIYQRIGGNSAYFSPKSRISSRILWVAASVILVLALGLGIGYLQLSQELEQAGKVEQTIVAPEHSRVRFNLPDGSNGWLNSGSTLSFSSSFDQQREVSLQGEAYFDVHKDEGRPFVVSSGKFRVRVLGTRFNVRNYQKDPFSQFVLAEGKVAISENGASSPYVLSPNERLTYHRNEKGFTRSLVDAGQYTAWTEGTLIFRDEKFSFVKARLENWYNVTIQVKNPEILDYQIYATFKEENIKEVMELIKLSSPISYKIKEREENNTNGFKKKQIDIWLK